MVIELIQGVIIVLSLLLIVFVGIGLFIRTFG